jgi:hypothetical protein
MKFLLKTGGEPTPETKYFHFRILNNESYPENSNIELINAVLRRV